MSKIIEEYYNKFCEDKRLLSRHGKVEFFVTTTYINKYLTSSTKRLLDVGAGTGRYSIYYSDLVDEVVAVELSKNNLGVLKAKKSKVKAYLGNALDLSKFEDNSFDIVLLLGPMYHLFTFIDKCQALKEAKRVCKNNGYIFVAYLLNDYSVISYGFKDNNIKEIINKGQIDENFQTISKEENLYSYERIENINKINKAIKIKREKIIAVDGPTDYMRNIINKMDEETFEIYQRYVLSIAERSDLIGASSHVLDILRKEENYD